MMWSRMMEQQNTLRDFVSTLLLKKLVASLIDMGAKIICGGSFTMVDQ